MLQRTAAHSEASAWPMTAAHLGSVLGWLSLGIGIAVLVKPQVITRVAGLGGGTRATRALRAVGLRELATGAGLLWQPQKTRWLWARTTGDVLDLGLLAVAARQAARHAASRRSDRIAITSALVAGITVLDLLAAWERQRLARAEADPAAGPAASGTLHVRQSLSINRSPDACYRFWRDFANFPSFMQNVDAVRMLDATRSHWTVRAPLGSQVEWTAELTSDVPSQQLGWRTLEGAAVAHAGIVRFAPGTGGRGTRVQVDLDYAAPLGKAGARIAQWFGEEPSLQVAQDLRRFKQLIETGEIPTTAGQTSGRRSLMTRALQPQRAPAHQERAG